MTPDPVTPPGRTAGAPAALPPLTDAELALDLCGQLAAVEANFPSLLADGPEAAVKKLGRGWYNLGHWWAALRRAVAAEADAERLSAAIRKHRDYRGDDRCFLDDRELYAALPEGYSPPPRDTAVTLEQCARFIACRHDPATEYVSPQRRIEELEAALRRIKAEYDRATKGRAASLTVGLADAVVEGAALLGGGA